VTALLSIEERGAVKSSQTADVAARRIPSTRYDSLDLWRGVACLVVVLYHSTLVYSGLTEKKEVPSFADSVVRFLHHGRVGVPMFFVISGYCIAGAACSAHDRRMPVGSYFWRRFRRIYPPYWIALALLVGLFLLFDWMLIPGILSDEPWAQYRPWWFSPSQWFGNLTLTESWRHHLGGRPRGHIIGQAWTLCYEEQFYFLMGMLLYMPRQWFFPGCMLLSLFCLIGQQFAHYAKIDISGFFFDGQWFSFAFGILVFFATNVLRFRGQLASAVLLILAAVVLPRLPGLGGYYLAFSAVFASVLVGMRPWDEELRRMKWLAPLFWCGTMCYSLYLVHQILVAGVSRACYWVGLTSAEQTLFIVVPLGVAVSLLAGWCFYQLVERRFLNPASVAVRS
jgi:peptidoglycan/LPS O-acetylase OafA/YrhL